MITTSCTSASAHAGSGTAITGPGRSPSRRPLSVDSEATKRRNVRKRLVQRAWTPPMCSLTAFRDDARLDVDAEIATHVRARWGARGRSFFPRTIGRGAKAQLATRILTPLDGGRLAGLSTSFDSMGPSGALARAMPRAAVRPAHRHGAARTTLSTWVTTCWSTH